MTLCIAIFVDPLPFPRISTCKVCFKPKSQKKNLPANTCNCHPRVYLQWNRTEIVNFVVGCALPILLVAGCDMLKGIWSCCVLITLHIDVLANHFQVLLGYLMPPAHQSPLSWWKHSSTTVSRIVKSMMRSSLHPALTTTYPTRLSAWARFRVQEGYPPVLTRVQSHWVLVCWWSTTARRRRMWQDLYLI